MYVPDLSGRLGLCRQDRHSLKKVFGFGRITLDLALINPGRSFLVGLVPVRAHAFHLF